MPNAGKSTLFNALTSGGAQTGDYPFTTIEPNVAVAQVPDRRLDRLAETLASSEVTPETIDFHDIAGLVKGASEGEGLGNQFLASIRETDAICHVVRVHPLDSGVPHPEGSVDPLRDVETIETELVLADYDQVERRLERVVKQARSGDAEAIAERDWLEAVRDALAAGRPVRSVPEPEGAPDAVRHLQARTSKPVLYVANVEEGEQAVPEALARHAAENDAVVIALGSAWIWRQRRVLDVISLGRDAAVSLGLDYEGRVLRLLAVVACMVAVSTALVGPVIFFGLLVSNMAYHAMGTRRHAWVLPAAVLWGCVLLMGGQVLLEQLFQFNTVLSIVVEFLGGIVFIVLLMRKGTQ